MTTSNRCSRRQFVHGIGAGLALTALRPVAALASGANGKSGRPAPRALTVIHLAGGLDAREIVVPRHDADYRRLRPTLALGADDLVPLDGRFGLSRACAALWPLWRSGRVAYVPRVVLPAPVTGHYRATEIWHTGDPFTVRASGWLGRAADWVEHRSLCVMRSYASAPDPRVFRRERSGPAAATPSRSPATGHSWPDALAEIAQSVAMSEGTEFHFLTIPHFDTHWGQAGLREGLLPTLAQALAAYQQTIDRRGCASRVVTLVFSEFGRTLAENHQGGTEHAPDAPVWLLGDPDCLAKMRPNVNENGAWAPLDLLALQSTILQEWLRIPASAVVPSNPPRDPASGPSFALPV